MIIRITKKDKMYLLPYAHELGLRNATTKNGISLVFRYEVVDEELFFLSVIKYGIEYEEV